jgi:hypothetical protein
MLRGGFGCVTVMKAPDANGDVVGRPA